METLKNTTKASVRTNGLQAEKLRGSVGEERNFPLKMQYMLLKCNKQMLMSLIHIMF
jgi:hypothetical protein